MGWTDERVAELKRRWIAGETSAMIAKALGGVSRSAVIGKLLRLGLTGSAAGAARSAPARSPRKRTVNLAKIAALSMPAPPPKAAPPAKVIAFPAEPIRGVDLLRLGNGCKWPLAGDHDPMLFCGRGRPLEQPYCAEHQALALNRSTSRKNEDPAKYARRIERLARRAG